MQFGLPKHTINAINTVFAKNNYIEKAILYGSRAKGNYRNGSDIDLTLIAPTLTLTDLFRIENELDDLLLPYTIDLSLFHQLNDADILEHINRVGVVFYERGNG